MKKFAPVLALVATTGLLTGSALALTAGPALATTANTASSHHVAAAHPGVDGKRLSLSRLAQVRERQQRMIAEHRAAPRLAKAGATTYSVDTTADSSLADSSGTTCVDASGKCSLRAAVEAANNLGKPVRILLRKRTYTLTSGVELTVTDAKGVSVIGKGAGSTSIAGAGSGLFVVSSDTGGKPATLYLTSLTLRDGTAESGGAVVLSADQGGALVLDHVTATGNSAQSQGGAIYAYEQSSIYISHSKFTHNQASYGAAIFQNWTDVSIKDTSFTENSTTPGASGYGGAIDNEYGVFDMKGGSISANTAGDGTFSGDGGGIYNDYATTTLTDVHLDHNTAAAGSGDQSGIGGAVFSYQDVFQMFGGTMSHNRAEGTLGSGGGVYGSQNDQVTLEDVSMVGNKASGSTQAFGGGTIYMYGTFYPSKLVVDGGRITRSNHSAVYLQSLEGGVDTTIRDATLTRNTDDSGNGLNNQGCGGVVCQWGSGDGGMTLTMQGNEISDNSSMGFSGSGAVSVYGSSDSTSAVTLRKNTFSKNQTGPGGAGGAVGLAGDTSSPVTLTSVSNTFSRNRAGSQSGAGFGGALAISAYSTTEDHGSTFSHNSARGDGASGGAVYNNGQDSSTWTRTRFVGNSAATNDEANLGYGGALWSASYAGEVLEQVTMADNRSAYQGGAFYGESANYQLVLEDSTVSGNAAGTPDHAGQGGGIFTNASVLRIENSTLTANKASSASGGSSQGGAIWASGSRVALHYSTVTGNYAHEGAGVYSDIFGSVVGSILSGNKTSKHGSEKDCTASDPKYKLASMGGNVLGQKGCVAALQSSDKVSRKLHLGKLKDNGGPTKTMAISKKSPAVGRASYLVPGTDQRGHRRPGKHADAGAFELPKNG